MMVRKPKGESWRPGMRKGMRYEDIKANKLRQESEIIDRMLENIMKDVEEGKVKKEDIRDIANIIAEKKLQAPTPEKFEKYEKQERFIRDLYEGIPPKEEEKRFFVNTFESYWKILQDYRKKGKVPADYSLFPAHIAEAIKRGQITTKDIEIVGTPSGFEYKLKKPVELPAPEERKLPLKPDVLVFGEETKEEEKPKEKPKPALPEEDRHYAIKVGKNKFLVKGFREYIVKAKKVDDKWIAEADDLHGSIFPYEGMEEEEAKGNSLEEVLDKISDRIDFRGVFPLEEEEKPEILEQRIKEIKDEVLKPKEKPSVSVAKVVGSDVLEFGEEKKETKPKKATKKEAKAGVEVLEFKAAEEKIDTGKAAEAVSEAVKQVSEKAKEMAGEEEGERKKKGKKKEGKEGEVVKVFKDKPYPKTTYEGAALPSTAPSSVTSLSDEDVARVRDSLLKVLSGLVPPEMTAKEKAEKEKEEKKEKKATGKFMKDSVEVAEKLSYSPEGRELLGEMLVAQPEVAKILAEKNPEFMMGILRDTMSAQIKEYQKKMAAMTSAEKEKVLGSVDFELEKTKKGLRMEGSVGRSVVEIRKGETRVLPESLFLRMQLENKRIEEERLRKEVERRKMVEDLRAKELGEFYKQRGMGESVPEKQPAKVVEEKETLSESLKSVMETPRAPPQIPASQSVLTDFALSPSNVVRTQVELPEARPAEVRQEVKPAEQPEESFGQRFIGRPIEAVARPVIGLSRKIAHPIGKGTKSAFEKTENLKASLLSPKEMQRTEYVSGVEEEKGIPYRVSVTASTTRGSEYETIVTERTNLVTGKKERVVEKRPLSFKAGVVDYVKEKASSSVPVKFLKEAVPLGSAQFRKWLHSSAGNVKPVSRELDWRKVEMRRLRLASRR